ncbi:unnamed protein product [Closterium sp. Naga37s-1]|nr:unnamed protein product [Closterium sp. Naga37s-1]
MPEKRDGDGPEGQELVPTKRQRTDLVAVSPGADGDKGKQLTVTKDGVKRTSSLLAPIMLLTGHAAGVFTMKFSPDGEVIASGSQDKEIFLWRIEGECDNYMVLKGHKNVILELQWTSDGHSIVSASPDQTVRAWDVETGKQWTSDGHSIVSASPDQTVRAWDVETGKRVRAGVGMWGHVGFGDRQADKEDGGAFIKKMAEHSSFINSCCLSLPLRDSLVFLPPPLPRLLQQIKKMAEHSSFVNSCCPAPRGPPLIVSGSDDGTAKLGSDDGMAKLWDIRVRGCIQTFPDKYQVGEPSYATLVVAACHPEAPRSPPLIVSGSDDGTAKLWDMRVRECIQTFPDKYQVGDPSSAALGAAAPAPDDPRSSSAVTAVAFSYNGDKVYSGGIDNQIKVWDLRKSGGTSTAAGAGGEGAAEGGSGETGGGGGKGAEPVMRLLGHTDTITGMRVSPDGAYLLTNAMDCTLRIWDLRPYAPQIGYLIPTSTPLRRIHHSNTPVLPSSPFSTYEPSHAAPSAFRPHSAPPAPLPPLLSLRPSPSAPLPPPVALRPSPSSPFLPPHQPSRPSAQWAPAQWGGDP